MGDNCDLGDVCVVPIVIQDSRHKRCRGRLSFEEPKTEIGKDWRRAANVMPAYFLSSVLMLGFFLGATGFPTSFLYGFAAVALYICGSFLFCCQSCLTGKKSHAAWLVACRVCALGIITLSILAVIFDVIAVVNWTVFTSHHMHGRNSHDEDYIPLGVVGIAIGLYIVHAFFSLFVAAWWCWDQVVAWKGGVFFRQ